MPRPFIKDVDECQKTHWLALSKGVGSKMNDPHVESLVYRIRHDGTVYYGGSDPAAYEHPAFDIQIANEEVRFTMRAHFATEDTARQAAEPFIKTWEFETALRQGRNTFTLVFRNAHIVDRKPNPPNSGSRDRERRALHVSARFDGGLDGTLSAAVQLQPSAPYPPPPCNNVEVTSTVQQMSDRYLDFREGKEPLPALAYFCLTCLEACAGGRSKAAAKFAVDKRVLDGIGRLAAEKGGLHARKAQGRSHALTDDEESFLKAAVPALIRRMAQVACDPKVKVPTIALSDLPPM